MSKISIIVPVSNVADYLSQCIESLLKQTFSDIEILLIDDNSTDGSEKICDEYALQDSRIHVFHQKKQLGPSTSRNIGIAHTKSPYLMFVDSDDYVSRDYCESLYSVIVKSYADIAVGKFYRVIGSEM